MFQFEPFNLPPDHENLSHKLEEKKTQCHCSHTHSLPHRQQWFNLHWSAQCLMPVKAYNFYMPKDSVSFGYFLKVTCWLITMLAIVLDLPKQNDESVSMKLMKINFGWILACHLVRTAANEVLTLVLHMRNKKCSGFVSPYSLTIRFYFVSFLFY